jgi:hypothetical protein
VTNGRIEFDAKTGGGAAAKKEVSFRLISVKLQCLHHIFLKSATISVYCVVHMHAAKATLTKDL